MVAAIAFEALDLVQLNTIFQEACRVVYLEALVTTSAEGTGCRHASPAVTNQIMPEPITRALSTVKLLI